MKDNPVTIRIKSGTKPLWDRYIEQLPPSNPEKYLTFAEWINFKVQHSLADLECYTKTKDHTKNDIIEHSVTTNNPTEEPQKVISIEEMFNDDF